MVWEVKERKGASDDNSCYCYLELVLLFIRKCLLNSLESIKSLLFIYNIPSVKYHFLFRSPEDIYCEHEITFLCYFLEYCSFMSVYIKLRLLCMHFRRSLQWNGVYSTRNMFQIYNTTKEQLRIWIVRTTTFYFK